MATAQLIGMSADVKGRTYTLEQFPFTIGRADDNDVKLESASASSHHCSITKQRDEYLLSDKGSTNGTRVNNKPVEEVTLHHKDLIQVGSVEFIFNIEGAVAPAAAAPAAFEGAEEVASEEAAEAPQTFSSISPFGTKQKKTGGPLMPVVILVTVAALAASAWFLWTVLMGK